MRLAPLLLLFWLPFVAVAGAVHAQGRDFIPERAYQHQRFAFAVWRDTLGHHAPLATLAAQVHKESSWRQDARSPFAHGLAQFTPATAQDICRWYPELRPCDTGDPRWSLRAQAVYMKRLMNRWPDAAEPWLFGLAGYNSGPGWTDRSRAVCRSEDCCDPERWAGHVEQAMDSRHAGWAFGENREYVRRIVADLGPMYERAGWGKAVPVPMVWQCLGG